MAVDTEIDFRYSLKEKLHEGRTTIVYKANLEPSGEPVVVKLPRTPHPELKELAKLRQEYNFAESLGEEAAVRPLGLQETPDGLVLILEDFGGISLKELVGRGRLAVRSFLKIARILAGHLSTIHAAGIIHKDIKPQNILINPDTNRVKIIDFGISSRISLKSQHMGNPEVLEGTLAYISPEQTGRMNRVVDYRSDLYSLGVTFYEILTGRLPFESRDSMELVHSHIARIPESVHKLNPKVPEILSDIVGRLMAKNAEERYQSAFGLKHDLEECLQRLDDGQIASFPLGSKDFSGLFQISQKLYGRDEEIEILMGAFKRVAAGGSELMLVAGVPGVGKSALVNEVHKPITGARGYFISGKYDQFQRNIPYYAIQQAFEEFVELLLTESTESLETWKKKILDAVGESGQVLINVIPGLAHILGEQPPVPELGPQESQARFNAVFQSFVRAISGEDHPLVIFIDDLQWTDGASLALTKALMMDAQNSHFLLIGAYRDNEVDPAHPFMLAVEELKKAKVNVHDIVLSNLEVADVNQLIADALLTEQDHVRELTGLVYNKTQGNPFFTTELLKDLYENSHLRFDFDSHRWIWEAAHLANLSITDNVVELMTQKLTRLDEKTQEVIKLAACVGNKFDLHTLSVILEKDIEATLDDLWPAVEESLLLPQDENYRLVRASKKKKAKKGAEEKTVFKFAHDRVQQASYGLIEEKQRQQIHLKIGRLLLKDVKEDDIEDHIFDISQQLNQGKDLITDPEERLRLARFNSLAAAKATKSSAFQSAISHLNTAHSLLDEETAWKEEHDLIWNIYANRADAENSTALFEEAEKDIQYALERSKTENERVRLIQIYLTVLFRLNRHHDCVRVARDFLRQLGIKQPKKINKVHVATQYLLYRFQLGFRRPRDLYDLSTMDNERMLNICKVINDSTASTYMVNTDVMGYISLIMARICLKYGNNVYSPFAWSVVGAIQAGVTKELKTAYENGQMAIALTEKYPDTDALGRAHFLMNGMMFHWRKPIAEHQEHMRIARQIFDQNGNLHFKNYCVTFTRAQSLLFYDKSLAEIEEENLKYYESHLKTRDREVSLNQYFLIKFLRRMRGIPMDDVDNQYDFDEEKYEAEMRTPGNNALRCYFWTFKMIEGYFFEDWDMAYRNAKSSFGIVLEVLGMCLDHPSRFFYVLTRLAMKGKLTFGQRLATKIPFVLNKIILRHEANNAPENYRPHHLLVRAEVAASKKKWDKAAELYDQAIEEGEKAKIPLIRCLANELAGKALMKQGKTKFAAVYLREAYRQYTRWSATAKVNHLEDQFPELLRGAGARVPAGGSVTMTATTTATTSTSGGTSTLDIGSVIKATQAISGEIKLENLLSKLMKYVIENAGAQRATLIMEKEGALLCEAEDSVEGEPTVLQGIPLAEARVPAGLLQYVYRSGQKVILADAANEGRYTNDPYISENGIKSILCHPITQQRRVIGVLYLENNLTTDAFTEDREEILKILASQAAVSLENSRLVSEETERQKLQKEMDIAKDLQMSILPVFPEDDAYNITAHMTPAEQVGGDYYDYYQVNGDRWIAIGDVTGHGLNSGLLMLMAQTGFSTYLSSTTQPDTKELFAAVNRTLCDNMQARTKQGLYMTFTALKSDSEGNFEHVGKHEDILVYRKATGKVEVVESDGFWMGVVPDVKELVQKANFKLNPGDFITLYTDGVIECRNSQGEQFDMHRLIKIIEENANQGIERVQETIVKSCMDFMDVMDDDITLFLMQKK